MNESRDWIIGLIFGIITGVGVTVAAYETEKELIGKQDVRLEIEAIKRELSRLTKEELKR